MLVPSCPCKRTLPCEMCVFLKGLQHPGRAFCLVAHFPESRLVRSVLGVLTSCPRRPGWSSCCGSCSRLAPARYEKWDAFDKRRSPSGVPRRCVLHGNPKQATYVYTSFIKLRWASENRIAFRSHSIHWRSMSVRTQGLLLSEIIFLWDVICSLIEICRFRWNCYICL